MRQSSILRLLLGMFFLVLAGCGGGGGDESGGDTGAATPQETSGMVLETASFPPGGNIPAKYTCDGDDTSPRLRIRDVPVEARSLALVLEDRDAPRGTFMHWAVWNIDPETTVIREGSVPPGAVVGTNDFGAAGFNGPCPPSGMHRYTFRLYALNRALTLPAGSDVAAFRGAVENTTIGEVTLDGKYGRTQ